MTTRTGTTTTRRLLAGPMSVAVAAAAIAALAAGPAIAADERTRIRSDEEIRALLDSVRGGTERLTEERNARLAERIGSDFDRVEARTGLLPLAAGHELSVARQNLNSLKTRDPHTPAIPLLERRLFRADPARR